LATSAGTISRTTANAPAACSASASSTSLLAGVAAALDAEPAQRVLALRGEPEVGHHRDARTGQRLDLRDEPGRRPSSFTACAPPSFMNRKAVVDGLIRGPS
jgi:hypothetical protein